MRVSQAFVREERNSDVVPATIAAATSTPASRTQVLRRIYFPFVDFLSACGDAIVLGVGSVLVHDGTIAAGT